MKTCRDLVCPSDVGTFMRPWRLEDKSDIQRAALLHLASHFTSPRLKYSAHLFQTLLAKSASMMKSQEMGEER